MKIQSQINVSDILGQISEHMVLFTYGTKKLEYNIQNGNYFVYNGSVIVWHGTDEKLAVQHYNQENSGIV